MRLFILIFLAFTLSDVVAQEPVDSVRIVNPSDFPEETNLPGNVAFYTREGGSNRKVTLEAILDKTVAIQKVELQRWQVQTSTNTLTLLYEPDVNSLEIFRGVIRQTVNSSGADVTLTGNILTFNYRNLKAGEIITVRYKKKYN